MDKPGLPGFVRCYQKLQTALSISSMNAVACGTVLSTPFTKQLSTTESVIVNSRTKERNKPPPSCVRRTNRSADLINRYLNFLTKQHMPLHAFSWRVAMLSCSEDALLEASRTSLNYIQESVYEVCLASAVFAQVVILRH
eukprot:1209692-Pleurochrysis_carterae.AAC.1